MKKGIIVGIIVGALIIAAGVFFITRAADAPAQKDVDAFAKCLTAKGAVMYGAFWCPHCAATKKHFGSSFRYIRYVECDPRGDNQQAELCISKNIENYDTWEFADSSRLVGEPSFASMAEKTACPLPGVIRD